MLPLTVPGGDRVRTLRKLPDADALKDALQRGGRVVVVGGGWIGLEVTAAAREYGAEVTLIEALAQPLARVLGDELGAVFADLHRAHGVDIRLNSGVKEITADGVVLPDGSTLPADLVLAGVGIRPDTRLAAEAGLAVDNGVLVDASLRTSDADIYAAGDVANVYTPQFGRRSGSSTGPTRSTAARRRPGRCSARTSPTTGCPTSSPTSTTWAWSTRAGPRRARTTGWSSAVTWTAGSSSRSGCPAGGCWPA